jgi:hypothetical protein
MLLRLSKRSGLLWRCSFLLVGTLSIAGWAFPQGTVQPSAQVEKRVDDLLSKMTLEEKITLLGGVNDFYTRPIARL